MLVYITSFGYVRGLDTRGTAYGETWAEGDILYVSQTTAGRLTNIMPVSGQKIIVAMVIVVHATSGVVFVRASNIDENKWAEVAVLGSYATKVTPTLTGLRETSVAMPANDINLATGNLFTKTITGATTLTVSNVPTSGTVGYFILQLTNGGSATVTWFSGVKWAGGTPPTLTASGKDILSFYTIDAGTTWNIVSIQKDVK